MKLLTIQVEGPEDYDDVADAIMLDDFLATATSKEWKITIIYNQEDEK